MPLFAVNVRAIVVAEPLSEDASAQIGGWEIYDYETNAEGQAVIRCDQLVNFESTDAENAIEDAKAAATGIDLGEDWEVESVSLWVDESIDVELDTSGSSPSPR